VQLSRGNQGEVVIRVDGTFDGRAANRLAGWLGEVPEGNPLVVDFSGVREFEDLALAALARGLAGRSGTLAVGGLTRHQERVLRYFGVELAHQPDEDGLAVS
jgi:STAS domain